MVTVSAYFKPPNNEGLEIRRGTFSRGWAMLNHAAYHKLVSLRNGRQVMIRLLNGQDRNSLINFFQRVPPEDVQFCKENLKDPKVLDYWLNPENSRRIMSLVAADVATNQIVASLNVYRGQQTALNVGEIQQILVSRSLQGLGLGSLLLDELIDLASGERLHWLKAEIAVDLKNIVKAFQGKGFEIRAILEDYFRDLKGSTCDAALMMRPLVKEDDKDF
jgi:ribosomal protein S18 acetylase RimI-like enzyme